jgi:multidrug efflux pump subunit AcrB
MWIVRLALRRTYTFVVMALLIAVLGAVSIYRMSTDIFPEINIPVVTVVWQFTGMPADEFEQRIILPNERVLTTSVNDIEHIESQSLFGVGIIRIYFQPGAKIEAAVAQTTATSQAILKIMPPGINPPYIVQYSATSVPIVQIAVSSDTLTEQQIYDYASNFIIQRLGTVQGARVPQPWGGKWPQVMVDLDLDELYARGLSPQDVQTAINSQNLIVPAGTAKIGDTEYYVKLNSSPDLVAAFNDIPVKTVNGVPVYVKDVAHVRMGYQVQTNIVRRDGQRAILMTILKGEGASTLSVGTRCPATSLRALGRPAHLPLFAKGVHDYSLRFRGGPCSTASRPRAADTARFAPWPHTGRFYPGASSAGLPGPARTPLAGLAYGRAAAG